MSRLQRVFVQEVLSDRMKPSENRAIMSVILPLWLLGYILDNIQTFLEYNSCLEGETAPGVQCDVGVNPS